MTGTETGTLTIDVDISDHPLLDALIDAREPLLVLGGANSAWPFPRYVVLGSPSRVEGGGEGVRDVDLGHTALDPGRSARRRSCDRSRLTTAQVTATTLSVLSATLQTSAALLLCQRCLAVHGDSPTLSAGRVAVGVVRVPSEDVVRGDNVGCHGVRKVRRFLLRLRRFNDRFGLGRRWLNAVSRFDADWVGHPRCPIWIHDRGRVSAVLWSDGEMPDLVDDDDAQRISGVRAVKA